ncbi:DUF3817 domain-containing protein [Stenotrophomonas maltophilia]|uniref:DUF3817 domain-containing protein n=1 Tax=Stenotrophomonas maltophilia TaxID=40324 RepID=UPI0010760B6F|nr:DUF3817 domain-containing protein [Stenotrophomonas maltophilia]TFZ45101.1 DUF3817 domain-containing protein [Stenotrophomonas maltophilia]
MNSSDRDRTSYRCRPHLLWLRRLCLLEAATLLALLLVAVPLKHVAGLPLAVSIGGPMHGFVFLLFALYVVRLVVAGHLSARRAGALVLAACLPLGGLYSWWSLR